MTGSVILFSKQDDFSLRAAAFARQAFSERLRVYTGKVGDPFPEIPDNPDTILSFLSPWIIPANLLNRADLALNWHPGSADYPGIGCYNFALYEEAEEFGAVSHIMAAKVDTGAIIEERRFPVTQDDSVETLKLRTMEIMLSMFEDSVENLASGKILEPCGVKWSRRPFTRKELNDLTVITTDMSEEEVKRRIRATTYPGYPGPKVKVGGEYFHYPVPDRKPLA